MKASNGKEFKQEKGLKTFPYHKYVDLISIANPFYRLIFLWAGLTGLRQIEILSIQIQDINFKNRILKYRVAKNDLIKEKNIPIRLFNETKKYIEKHQLKGKDYLFKVTKGRYKGNRLSEGAVQKKTRYYFEKIGLGIKKDLKRKLNPNSAIQNDTLYYYTFHSLRHLYASLHYFFSHDKKATAWSLGHVNDKTVDQYIDFINYEEEKTIQDKIIEKMFV
jgi:integrase